MTRVNLIPVEELTDQHLLAEWRELKMVPASLRRSLNAKNPQNVIDSIPTAYCLGRGHVTFFYDKLAFLTTRYRELRFELLSRGVKLNNLEEFTTFCSDIPFQFFHRLWTPTKDEVKLSQARIKEKILMKPSWYRYRGVSGAPEITTWLNK